MCARVSPKSGSRASNVNSPVPVLVSSPSSETQLCVVHVVGPCDLAPHRFGSQSICYFGPRDP